MSRNLMQSRNFLKEEIRKFSHSSVALSRTLCIMSSHEWITTQELQSWYPWLTTWLLTKFRKQRLLHYIKAGHKTLLYNLEKFEAALERLACGWSGGSRDNFRRSAVCGSPEPRRLDADATRSMHERSKADGSGHSSGGNDRRSSCWRWGTCAFPSRTATSRSCSPSGGCTPSRHGVAMCRRYAPIVAMLRRHLKPTNDSWRVGVDRLARCGGAIGAFRYGN